jgi:hypothetical protein
LLPRHASRSVMVKLSKSKSNFSIYQLTPPTPEATWRVMSSAFGTDHPVS